MNSFARAVTIALIPLIAAACVDSQPGSSDTSRPVFQNTGEASHVEMLRIDSMGARPTPGTVPRKTPRVTPEAAPSRVPPVIGETRRDAPVATDPMPPLRGETSKGATMPVYRDSVRGPLNEIDSKGRVGPIKK